MLSIQDTLGKDNEKKYTFLSELGKGGMSIVYLAKSNSDGKQVAIKFINPEIKNSPQYNNYRTRFNHEAEYLSKFEHPNMVRLIEHDKSAPYLVLEYIPGITLKKKIRESKTKFSPMRALEILRPIAEVLNEAHKIGLIHRDIKPDNIIINESDGILDVKLIDLGIAKIMPGCTIEELTKLTDEKIAIGTCAYMSPEQCQSKEDIDGRADIYSLALVFYELIAGYPFIMNANGNNPEQKNLLLMYHNINTPIPELTSIIPSIPKSFSQVIHSALSKDKENRQKTCIQLINEIEKSLNLIINKRFKLLRQIEEQKNYKTYKVKDIKETLPIPLQAKVFNPEKSINVSLGDTNIFKEIKHRNLVNIIDSGKCTDTASLFFIYEDIVGESLASLFAQKYKFEFEHVIGYAIQITEVVSAYHEKGSSIYYKYLTPNNIILTNFNNGYGNTKLLNRLLFRNINLSSALETQYTESQENSYLYSPERILNDNYDGSQQDDVYSICVILSKMLLGDYFHIRSSKEEKIIFLEKYLSNISNKAYKNFINILIKGVAINPSDRYKNALVLLSSLNQIYLAIQALKDNEELPVTETKSPPPQDPNNTNTPEPIQKTTSEDKKYYQIIIILLIILLPLSILASNLFPSKEKGKKEGEETEKSKPIEKETTIIENKETTIINPCETINMLLKDGQDAIRNKDYVVSLNKRAPIDAKTALDFLKEIRKLSTKCPQSSNGDVLKAEMLQYYEDKIATTPKERYFQETITTYRTCQKIIEDNDKKWIQQ